MSPLPAALPRFAGGTRARAEEFARVLDGPPPGRRRPAAATSADVSTCAGLAQRLARAGEELGPVAGPRPEFHATLRTRLMAVAAVQPQPAASARPSPAAVAPVRPVRRASRALTVAAGVTASLVAVSGVAVASSQSLPGDLFYGVKRTSEAVRLATAGGEFEQGRRHLDFAATRLRELRGLTLGREAFEKSSNAEAAEPAAADLAAAALADPEVAERVRQVLADMDTETRKGTDLLTSAFLSSQTQAPLQALSRFATRQSTGLERLLPALPPASQDRAMASLALVVEVADETQGLMKGDGCPPVCLTPPATAPAPLPTQDPVEPGPGAGVQPTPTVTPGPGPEGKIDPFPLDGVKPGTPGRPLPQPSSPGPPPPSPTPPAPPDASPAPAPTPTTSRITPLPLLPLNIRALGADLPGALVLLSLLDQLT